MLQCVCTDQMKSSKEDKEPKSRAKNHKIKIDRTEYCKVNKEELPEDAEFKGYKSYNELKFKVCRNQSQAKG